MAAVPERSVPAAVRAASAAGALLRGWRDRASSWLANPVPTAVASGVACFVGLQLLLGFWVHRFYEGHYSGPLIISSLFRIPESVLENGIRPVVQAPAAGWDSQFYYYCSLDPLAQDPQV